MRIPKNRNKIKQRSITCCHIWHIDISKYAYRLDTYFVKVWWNYVLPNTKQFFFVKLFSDIWWQMTNDRQNSEIIPTDRHFLFLSDSSLYNINVVLGLGPFFPEVAKIVKSYLKSNENWKLIHTRISTWPLHVAKNFSHSICNVLKIFSVWCNIPIYF